MGDDPQILTSVSNPLEAEMVIERLREHGIHAISQRAFGGLGRMAYGSCNVYVPAGDLARARKALDVEKNAFSDEELTRLSEQAGRHGRKP